MIARAKCQVRVGEPASARWFVVVVPTYVRSQVADPSLAGRPTLVRTEVGDGVIKIDAAAHRSGIGEHVGRVAKLELFAEPGRDLVAVHRGVSGGQIDHRLQTDLAGSPSSVRKRLSSTGPTPSTRATPVPAVRASSLRWT